jgi:sugar/nucleoside kinase (ribokinase family)
MLGSAKKQTSKKGAKSKKAAHGSISQPKPELTAQDSIASLKQPSPEKDKEVSEMSYQTAHQHRKTEAADYTHDNLKVQQSRYRVLVVGSCGLDRLLTLDGYPEEEAKVRTTAYHEMGGGNAANTAHAIALLSRVTCLASFMSNSAFAPLDNGATVQETADANRLANGDTSTATTGSLSTQGKGGDDVNKDAVITEHKVEVKEASDTKTIRETKTTVEIVQPDGTATKQDGSSGTDNSTNGGAAVTGNQASSAGSQNETQGTLGTPFLQVALCTRVGDDAAGRQVMDELKRAGVDISPPLFQIGPPDSTTGLTTVLVNTHEHTRTCIHTPGTCGEVTMDDVVKQYTETHRNGNASSEATQDSPNTEQSHAEVMDYIFAGVVHLHLDGRHLGVALPLAKEARKRNITVSMDVEKDRQSPALDELLSIATHIFTNMNMFDAYRLRLTTDYEEEHGRDPLNTATVVRGTAPLTRNDLDFYLQMVQPMAFLTRWHPAVGKEVIVTLGQSGAVHLTCNSIDYFSNLTPSVFADRPKKQHFLISYRSTQPPQVHICHESMETLAEHSMYIEYTIHQAGTLSNIIVEDTTGAGDSFAGGYILSLVANQLMKTDASLAIQTNLEVGCWVAGHKVQGPGPRAALPTSAQFDSELGLSIRDVHMNLQQRLSSFPRPLLRTQNNAEGSVDSGDLTVKS